MRKFGVVLMLATMALLMFVKMPMQVHFFIGAFGVGTGFVLVLLSSITKLDD